MKQIQLINCNSIILPKYTYWYRGLCVYKFVCYNHTTKYTDWCPKPNDGGWGICLRMWKPEKVVALNILNNGRVYIMQSVITLFFLHGPDDRNIMESQCINGQTRLTCMMVTFFYTRVNRTCLVCYTIRWRSEYKIVHCMSLWPF